MISRPERVSGVYNLEGKPVLVAINKAAIWKVQGREHLVVLVDIADDDETTGLCGNCLPISFPSCFIHTAHAVGYTLPRLRC